MCKCDQPSKQFTIKCETELFDEKIDLENKIVNKTSSKPYI